MSNRSNTETLSSQKSLDELIDGLQWCVDMLVRKPETIENPIGGKSMCLVLLSAAGWLAETSGHKQLSRQLWEIFCGCGGGR